MAPLPLFAIRGASAATRKYGTLTLSEYTRSNTSSVVSCVGPNGKIPALLIRISTWPFPSSTALLATSRALDASRRSDEIKSAAPPAARISAAVFSPRSALRPTTMTWKPSWASLLATARPIPLVPPVISAVNELVVICDFPFDVTRRQGGLLHLWRLPLLLMSAKLEAECGEHPVSEVGLAARA